MTPFYSLPILVLLLFSCKKDEESELWTEVHVTATNYNTGAPINDIIVGVYERKTKLMLQDSEVETLREELLVNGQFSFGWKAKKNSKYSYEFAAVTDFEKYEKVFFTQFEYLQKGNIYNYEMKLVERAYLNLGYVNTNCENENDEMRFRYYFKHPVYQQYIYIYIVFIGTMTYTGMVALIFLMVEHCTRKYQQGHIPLNGM